MRSRRALTFTVGTGLLTASLATGTTGCNKTQTADVNPDDVAQPTVNEGMVPEPEEPEAPSDTVVNEGPVPDPEDGGETPE